MLSYETAVKLKEAGFPQKGAGAADFITKDIPIGKAYWLYYPTLSELIEACGEDGIFLWKFKNEWCAKEIDIVYHCFSDNFIDDYFGPQKGSFPEEAVAALRLAFQPTHKEIIQALKGVKGIIGE